jgi:adenylylsulfate kinase
MRKGFTLWFTGLSGSGKSTLSTPVAAQLEESGYRVELLDGDEVRTHLSKGLGFSKEDRDTNIRRIGWVAKTLSKHGVVAITAAISPYRDVRDEVRKSVEKAGAGFVEVYVKCSIEKLSERDVKGLYKKALAGEIKNFTGVSDPYEEPSNPDVVVDSGVESVQESAKKIVEKLKALGYLN